MRDGQLMLLVAVRFVSHLVLFFLRRARRAW